MDDVKAHARWNFALQQQVRWSKNVMEERDCPDQILMGAMDPHFCVLLLLGAYLEMTFMMGGGMGAKYLYTTDDSEDAAGRLNKAYQRHFAKLRDDPEFIRVAAKYPGGAKAIGSHSNRKLPKTLAKHYGINSQDSDIRGRWRRNRANVSDRYEGEFYRYDCRCGRMSNVCFPL